MQQASSLRVPAQEPPSLQEAQEVGVDHGLWRLGPQRAEGGTEHSSTLNGLGLKTDGPDQVEELLLHIRRKAGQGRVGFKVLTPQNLAWVVAGEVLR